jgi:hypothetical protein
VPLVIVGVLLAILGLVALVPLSIAQRYRMSTTRRRARGWLAAVNAAGFALSIACFLAGAAFTTHWVPDALRYTLAGLAAGCTLGFVGLLLVRWEAAPDGLHYTPNRWLAITVTAVVAIRLLYGWLRAYHAWSAGAGNAWWLTAAGAAGSFAAGALVLGYQFTFWSGLRRRLLTTLRSADRAR